MLATEAPKITDWMQAWGSIAGLVMSTVAVLFTGLLLRHEIRIRREEKESTDSGQAQLIVVGVEHYSGNEEDGWTGVLWFVRNESPAPISNLIVCPQLSDDLDHELFAGRSVLHRSTEIVTADSRVQGQWVFDDPKPFEAWKTRDPRPFVLEILFRDAAGVTWHRRGSDQPTRSAVLPQGSSLMQLAAEAYGVPYWIRHPSRWVRRHAAVRRRRLVKHLQTKIDRRWWSE
ncbi:hypothetical protein [Micromonospora sp. MH99]|uniref:hypothetical protein n=1 Tax=Micromonospora sp. MH99 TaxID=1945510 RepID=UPI001F23344B|nr:hypothetical protein [Micromonospora sp. MH99]